MLAATGCKMQQTGICGVTWEGPISDSELQRVDDDDNDDYTSDTNPAVPNCLLNCLN